MAVLFDIKYKANENWEAARILKDRRHYNAAASRMYYALFYYPYQKMVEDGRLAPEVLGGKHTKILIYLEETEPQEVFDMYREVYNLRGAADYEKEPVSKDLFERKYKQAEKVRLHFSKKM